MMINVFESVVDETLKTYSPFVFEEPEKRSPKIKEYVRGKIIQDIKRINALLPVVQYFIKGSILTHQWTEASDIDVYIRVKSDKSEEEIRDILYETWLQIDDRYLKGVPHPLQYYVTAIPYNLKNTEAAYDLNNNTWIKHTASKNIDIDDYLKEYTKYVDQFSDFSEEIRRGMVDLDILKEIPRAQLDGLNSKIKRKLNKLEKSLNELLDTYEQVRDDRNNAFAKDMTPSDIKKYGIKTRLPGNVVFKMLERYHYNDLAKKIRGIIGADNKLSMKEYKKLNGMLKTTLTKEKTSFKSIMQSTGSPMKPIKGRGDMQHKAKHRHQRDDAGVSSAGAKTLRIVPKYINKEKTKKEGDRAVDNAKKGGGIIRVKEGSPRAKFLAKKYRIDNPTGKKTVGGNEHTTGVTIIFVKETLDEKITRAKLMLDNK